VDANASINASFIISGFYIISGCYRARVRISPPHPLVCRKRRPNGAALRMRPEKPKHCVTAGVAQNPSLLEGPECRALA
jgi:hypothetical protein